MYCNKCGAKVDGNSNFCNKCGAYLNNFYGVGSAPINNVSSINNKEPKIKIIGIGVFSGVGILGVIVLFMVLFNGFSAGYFFSSNSYENQNENNTLTENSGNDNNGNNSDNANNKNDNNIKVSKGKTVIITDNVYNGVSISGVTDAYNLISKDSVNQKGNCPKEILQVENDIIKKYNITAVNLCEMDVEFAKELENVFGVIYNEFPQAREHLTNLTLINTTINDNYIAAFQPVFNFATSNTSSTYPWIIKTQVFLSTTYFLNKSRLDASVKDGSSSGHFPPNSTIYSPVAHELGHYLSFLAMLNNYDMDSILLIDSGNVNTFYKVYDDFLKGDFTLKMLNEAYNNANTNLDFDTWRGTISGYALAKDNSGEYIYDETVAEAFHDVYLNKDNACDASKYVVEVLKKYIES